jgi:hypothetical protein
MATINLGNIKFNWKGTYNAGTAYAIDDVVSYNGSSYVCIQASTNNLPTVTAYWDVMSSAGTNGTNGTDLTTTLTTQGDIVYRDGSGLARLGYGTAGQVLQTGGSGANPSWATLTSDWVKIAKTDVTAVSAIDFQDVFTTDYDTYKLYINGVRPNNENNLLLRWFTSGTTEDSSSNYNQMSHGAYRRDSDNNRSTFLDATTGSSAVSISLFGSVGNSGSWSGTNNFELTMFDPKRNHKVSGSKGGSLRNDMSYVYAGTHQIIAHGKYWHNTTGGSGYSGFRLFWNNSASFQANGTIALYGLKA